MNQICQLSPGTDLLTVLMPYSNLIEEILSAMHYASTYIKGMMHYFPISTKLY